MGYAARPGRLVATVIGLGVAACGGRTPLDVGASEDSGAPGNTPLESGTPDAVVDAPEDTIAEAAPCSAGSITVGGACLPVIGTIAAPRPLAPLSTARVASRWPALRWELPAGTDGALVEMFADRACTQPLTSFLASTSGTPSTPLAAGVAFWRLRGTSNGAVGSTTSPVWELFVPARNGRPKVNTGWGTTLDVNGDGLGDVGVSALTIKNYIGQAYIYMGRKGAGPSSTPVILGGMQGPQSEFGCSIDSAGDVNGDGFGDLIVTQCDGATLPMATTAAYLYPGVRQGSRRRLRFCRIKAWRRTPARGRREARGT